MLHASDTIVLIIKYVWLQQVAIETPCIGTL